jgi:CheY-like chemotaxis protein
MRLAAERAEAERIAAERRREAAALADALADAQAAAQAERERLAALEAQREAQAKAQAQAQAQQVAALRAEQERQAAERAAAKVPRRASKTAAQTLVLVADDSKVVRIKTGRLLAQHQYQVAYAIDGLDAVQQMQAQPPDVLITDVEMPGMDGFELTRHLRADPQTAQLPVIMITAADDRHREQADASGVSVLLGKPYPEDALIAHIRLAMGHDVAAPLAAATSAHAVLDTVV